MFEYRCVTVNVTETQEILNSYGVKGWRLHTIRNLGHVDTLVFELERKSYVATASVNASQFADRTGGQFE